MTEDQKPIEKRSAIEAGVDVIVLGSSFEAMIAAASLGKAGLKTVLFETGTNDTNDDDQSSRHAPLVTDGLISHLDPDSIDALDLYRMGLSFAARRLDTIYFLNEGETIRLEGDFASAGQNFDDHLLEPFAKFSDRLLQASTRLAINSIAQVNTEDGFLSGNASTVLSSMLPDDGLRAVMLSESLFGVDIAPDEPFGFSGLLHRMSGEVVGLQAAIGYPDGGIESVLNAARRAMQTHRVDVRRSPAVTEILVEWDGVAGVHLDDGGQIRAPNVISGLSAEDTFLKKIGPSHINVQFQAGLSLAPSRVAKAQLQLEISGSVSDDRTQEFMRSRLVVAPSEYALKEAVYAARRGEIPSTLILEAFFPDVLEGNAENETQNLIITAYPVPMNPADDNYRDKLETAVLSIFENIAPKTRKRIKKKRLLLVGEESGDNAMMLNATRPLVQQRAYGQSLKSCSGITGLHYCGADAQSSGHLSGRLGRDAAKAVIQSDRRGDE